MTFHTAIARLREASYAAPSAGEGPNTCLVGRHDLRTALHVIDRLDADLRRVGVISHGAVHPASEAVRGQRGWDVIDDMRAAVRFAPSSAYWSERLREFFGPDAREGIDALEKQLRDARYCQKCNGTGTQEYRFHGVWANGEECEDCEDLGHLGDENGGHRLVEPDHETALALADAPRSLRNYVAALRSAIAAAPTPPAQASGQAAPSDEHVSVVGMPEFDALLDHIYEHGTTSEGVRSRADALARALLSRYGRPAGDAQPVAWVAADTLNSPHPTCISSLAYMSQLDRERGREYVPLYAAPVAAQTADDARDAADPLQGAADWLVKSLDKPRPAEIAAHLLIGHNRAERLFNAAIAQQRQGEGSE